MIDPMAGTFRYFAYGSNMLTRRLTATDRAPSAIAEAIGFLEGRQLTFDKVSRDGSGKCDIEATGNPTDRVYGVVFRISTSDESALHRAEGLDKGYRKAMVQVVTASGRLPAVAYIATEKDPTCRPYHWYKALVVAGAVEHGLPAAYVEWLRTLDSKPDLDPLRRAQNEGLLCTLSDKVGREFTNRD